MFGGDGYETDASKKVIAWLRRADRIGATLLSIGGATATLAAAGLLNGRSVSVHWMQRAAMADAYPNLEVLSSIFTVERRSVSCAGGAATLDMMLELISKHHGQDLAIGVADRLICSTSRTADYDQTISVQRRAGVRHDKLSDAIKIMQEHIEDPLSPSDVAALVGISTRQLERLFSRYLNSSPKSYYLKQRLERSRALLQQTNMRVIDVAIACGFTSASHFSKVYRRQYGTTPYLEKGVGSSS